MKGPGGRLKFDIRRQWECPVCHRRKLTPGDVVTRLCTCSAKSDPPRQNWMKLLEQKPARPEPSPPPIAPVEHAVEVTEVAQQLPPPVNPPPEIAIRFAESAQQVPPPTTSPSPASNSATPHVS
jgi:hypothetical protein